MDFYILLKIWLAMRQKVFEHAKPSATDARKTISKRGIQKTAEATG